MIRLIFAALAGGGIGYLFGTSKEFRRQVEGKAKAAGELGSGFRLPQPSTALELPARLEDFNDVDASICECAKDLSDPVTIQRLIDEGVLPQPGSVSDQEFQLRLDDLVQLCAASDMFPPEDVQWPPVPGDHPSIHEFWGIVGYRLRRIRIFGLADEVCPKTWSVQPIGPALEFAVPGQIGTNTDEAITFQGANLPATAEVQGIHQNDASVMFDSVQMGAVTQTEAQAVVRASTPGKYTILMRTAPDQEWVPQELSITAFGPQPGGGNLAPGG